MVLLVLVLVLLLLVLHLCVVHHHRIMQVLTLTKDRVLVEAAARSYTVKQTIPRVALVLVLHMVAKAILADEPLTPPLKVYDGICVVDLLGTEKAFRCGLFILA